MKARLFFLAILFQISIAAILLHIIHKKKAMQRTVLSPIRKETIEFDPSETFRFFYEPKPNTDEVVERDWLSYTPTYHITNDSLHERYEYNEKKDEKVFRIITLGDSFTFGAYVDTSVNWTELLEDDLNKKHLCSGIKKYEVINLGVDGYDTAYEVERYLKRGQKYKPDLLIMLVTDYGRVTEHRLLKNRIMPTLSIKQKEEYRKMGNYYPEVNIYDGELSHAKRADYQSKSMERLMGFYKGPLLFINFNTDGSYDDEMAQLKEHFKQIILEKMRMRRDNKRYLLPDWHPNNEGHKAIMEEIGGFLKTHTLLPCR